MVDVEKEITVSYIEDYATVLVSKIEDNMMVIATKNGKIVAISLHERFFHFLIQ